MKKILIGHTSPETAYLVDDYPYGFRLRCQIRFWLEHDPKKGTRFCSQTTNPKVLGTVWNKPKKGTYADVGVMLIDDKGHVRWTTTSAYDELPVLRAWLREYACGLDDVAFAAAGKLLSQKTSYERLKAAGVPWQHAGAYAAAIGLPNKQDGMPFTTAQALANYAKRAA